MGEKGITECFKTREELSTVNLELKGKSKLSFSTEQ